MCSNLEGIIGSRMSPRRSQSRVQSFPFPEIEVPSLMPKAENLNHLERRPISSNRLAKLLNASMVAQKLSTKLALDAISPARSTESDWKFINSYLDSTVLLLDTCSAIQRRLESIRICLGWVPIGLHYLEGEHEPSMAVLRRAASAIEASLLNDSRHCSKMEKSMSRLRMCGKKLSGRNSVSRDLYKALTSSWTMALLAISVLSSATSFGSSAGSPAVQPSGMSNKMKAASIEDIAGADLAAHTLLKLISAWKAGEGSKLRRTAVKALSWELTKRKQVVEKILPVLEDRTGELYRNIIALRVGILGFISMAQKKEVVLLEMVKDTPAGYQETQIMNSSSLQFQRAVTWVGVGNKVAKRSRTSIFRFGVQYCLRCFRSSCFKRSSPNL